MRKKDFSALLIQVSSLNTKQKAQLAEALSDSKTEQLPAQLINEAFSAKLACPSCSNESVHKWGVVSGLQRYRCKKYKRTFNALTGTSISRKYITYAPRAKKFRHWLTKAKTGLTSSLA